MDASIPVKDSFKTFVKTGFGRKFIGMLYTDETNKSLADYCNTYGFDLTTRYDGTSQAQAEFDFHTTIFYSENESYRVLRDGIYGCPPIMVQPDSFAIFGPNKNCLVLKLKYSPSLEALRHMFYEKYNLYDKWPSYNPHITLTYNYNDQAFPPLPDFMLMGGMLKISTIQD